MKTKKIKKSSTNSKTEDFPKELLETFKACVKKDWGEEVYNKFCQERAKFLGKKNADKLEQGILVVVLTKLLENKKEKKNDFDKK